VRRRTTGTLANPPSAALAARAWRDFRAIELLRQENFSDQVVITSLDLVALRQVESIEPSLRTAHIVTAAVGDVVRSEADFLSLSSARATPSLIRRAHAVGNKPEVMLRMIEAL
jgi:hypothetical protein